MKKALLMVFACGMLMACHSDIDLKNVDTTSQLEMGVALPIGSVRAQLGDFVGQIPDLYVDSAHEGVITLRKSFIDERSYHDFDIKKHISKKDTSLNVYDALSMGGAIDPEGIIIDVDVPITIHFDIPIKLNGINTEVGKERLDSAIISNARFSSIIDTSNLPIKWEWIDKVVLDLGNQVCRKAGKTKVVYEKGQAGGFGKKFNTDIDNFSISLMKDKTYSIEKNSIVEYAQNVDSIFTFGVDFMITVPKTVGEIKIKPNALFSYGMEVEFIDYVAIWGYFDPSKDMISKTVKVDLEKELGSLTFLKNANIPFTDPQIDVAVTTKIAGAMMLTGNYVYVLNNEGDSVFASFDGNRKLKFTMNPWMHPDPAKPGSAIGNSITDTVHFNKSAEYGLIDRMFGKMPKELGYDFYVDINSKESPQIRILPDTKVSIDAICKLPMKFREGLFVDYSDTINDVNLSAVNIDSLVRESQLFDTINAGEVTLYLTALSEIPMTVKAVFQYLDKFNQPIKDPSDPSQLFNPFLEDTIRIAPPRFEKNTAIGKWVPVEPGKSVFTAHMSKEKLQVVPNIKRIAYRVIVDNEALNYAFKANPGLPEAPLNSEQHLELNIGLTAQIDAVLNFNSKK